MPPICGQPRHQRLERARNAARRGIEAHSRHPRGLGDIQPTVMQIDTVRAIEIGKERAPTVRETIAVPIRLKQHDQPSARLTEDEITRCGRRHQARARQITCKDRYAEPLRHPQLLGDDFGGRRLDPLLAQHSPEHGSIGDGDTAEEKQPYEARHRRADCERKKPERPTGQPSQPARPSPPSRFQSHDANSPRQPRR